MPKGPHWIETHGDALGRNLAARPAGVMVIGLDSRLWAYPTNWARPWTQQGPEEATVVTASAAAIYVITPSGDVSRIVNGQWTAYAGSAEWKPQAIAASVDDALFAIVNTKSYRIVGGTLSEAPCGSVAATTISASTATEIFVTDEAGTLYHGTSTSCDTVETPAPVQQLAATPGRIVVVAKDGTLWRRRGEEKWQRLPAVRKHRPGRRPYETLPAQVAVSAYSTWLLDREGSVFVLSDEA